MIPPGVKDLLEKANRSLGVCRANGHRDAGIERRSYRFGSARLLWLLG